MKTVKLSKATLKEAEIFITEGGVVIFPTDTVYGFLADATNKKAVNKIYKIKKRPKSSPLPIFIKDFKMAKELAEIDAKQEKIIKKYWPGKYTFVLTRKSGIKLYGANKETIALRIPKYKFLNTLLKKIDKPLVQTSANISGEVVLGKISEIVKQFGKKEILLIDGGDIKNKKSSKIIDLTKTKIKILRN